MKYIQLFTVLGLILFLSEKAHASASNELQDCVSNFTDYYGDPSSTDLLKPDGDYNLLPNEQFNDLDEADKKEALECCQMVVKYVNDKDKIGTPLTCMDNCPNDYNPDQEDADGNGVGDACESADKKNSACSDEHAEGSYCVEQDKIDLCAPMLWTCDQSTGNWICDFGAPLSGVDLSACEAPGLTVDKPDKDDDSLAQCRDDQILNPELSTTDDADDDGYPDACDNCPKVYNPGIINPNPKLGLAPIQVQIDSDGDGVGDLCEPKDEENDDEDDEGDIINIYIDSCCDGGSCSNDDPPVDVSTETPKIIDEAPFEELPLPDPQAISECEQQVMDSMFAEDGITLITPDLYETFNAQVQACLNPAVMLGSGCSCHLFATGPDKSSLLSTLIFIASFTILLGFLRRSLSSCHSRFRRNDSE